MVWNFRVTVLTIFHVLFPYNSTGLGVKLSPFSNFRKNSEGGSKKVNVSGDIKLGVTIGRNNGDIQIDQHPR